MKTIMSLLVCFFFLISVGKSQESKHSFKENYELSAPAKLFVSTHVGSINVIPTEGNEIEVLYIAKKNNKIISINKDDIQKEGILLTVKHNKTSLDLNVKYPDNYFKSNFLNQVHIGFEIHVPKETECELITDEGNITINGLISNQECKTDDGNINISEVTGNITIKKSDSKINLSKIIGSISINASDAIIHLDEIEGSVFISASDKNMYLKNIKGSVNCKTLEGNIELINVNGKITAKTSEGHILFTDLSGSINAYSMDGDVKGNVLELKKPVLIEAGGGNIEILLTNNIGLDLNIKGKRKDTPLQKFRGSSNEYFMKGKINGGGIEVELLSIDGEIIVNY